MVVGEFWGKAQPIDPDRGPQWHPLACHSLDVAAVAEALLESHRRLGESLAHLLGLPYEDAASLTCYLIALHDIGKFAKKFQAKVPSLYPSCFGDDPASLATRFDHGAGGMRLFDADSARFRLPAGARARTWPPLIAAVTGHHGAPPERRNNESLASLRPDFGQAGIEAALEFVRQAHELLSPPQRVPELKPQLAMRASFALAGLAVLADWIGSKQTWFPYSEPVPDIEAYWRTARDRARRAVREAGVVPAGISRHLDYCALLGGVVAPSPMQIWAADVTLPAGPALFMIEDETGSGKTEAALMLAHRLMESGAADGLYVALPTMATANAMFDRLADACRQLFAPDAEPSLALAHGAREMHAGFRDAMPRGGRFEAPYTDGRRSDDASETTASAACAAWISDDRRKTFLADAGAGTIDQALLSVLPSRHQSLRLLGLIRRVLILDEVHAYDAYMQREMERLLEFQAGLGGSVILLSATLPLSVRERLTGAFTKGLGKPVGDADPGMDYPLVTVCAADLDTSTKVAGRPDRARTLPVRFLRSSDDALDEIRREALGGKAVLYLRNSVDDALDAHAALTARGLNPEIFHARFALGDRLAIEKRIVEAFGKSSTPADRTISKSTRLHRQSFISPESGLKRTWSGVDRTDFGDRGGLRNGLAPADREGRVLIATQVVEQSLDLDFDVLVTDLAPIDLLIQRAGRLWRHAWRQERLQRTGQPELLVVGPKPVDNADAEWFARAFPRAKYVYRDHARLWLSARALEDAGAIESPAGLRALIESVYGDDADTRIPAQLQGIFFDAEGRAGADRGVATTNLLDFSKGYVRDGGAWDSDARTPTRLNDVAQVTLRLACVRDGRIEPYAHRAATDELWRAWRLSEVSVAAHRVGGEAVPPAHAEGARAARAHWTRFDAEKILVVLERSDAAEGILSGVAMAGDESGNEVRIGYDPIRGLEIERDR